MLLEHLMRGRPGLSMPCSPVGVEAAYIVNEYINLPDFLY